MVVKDPIWNTGRGHIIAGNIGAGFRHRQFWRGRPTSPFPAILQPASTSAFSAGASCHASPISGQQSPSFERRHGVKSINPTLFFAFDTLALPEILPKVSVVMQGYRLGEIEPKPFGRGPSGS